MSIMATMHEGSNSICFLIDSNDNKLTILEK